MTRVARCKKTIAHWKRMIAWVKSVVADDWVVDPNAVVRVTADSIGDADIMADCIGEDWYSNYCSFWRKWLSAAEKMLAMLEDVLKQEQRRAAKQR